MSCGRFWRWLTADGGYSWLWMACCQLIVWWAINSYIQPSVSFLFVIILFGLSELFDWLQSSRSSLSSFSLYWPRTEELDKKTRFQQWSRTNVQNKSATIRNCDQRKLIYFNSVLYCKWITSTFKPVRPLLSDRTRLWHLFVVCRRCQWSFLVTTAVIQHFLVFFAQKQPKRRSLSEVKSCKNTLSFFISPLTSSAVAVASNLFSLQLTQCVFRKWDELSEKNLLIRFSQQNVLLMILWLVEVEVRWNYHTLRAPCRSGGVFLHLLRSWFILLFIHLLIFKASEAVLQLSVWVAQCHISSVLFLASWSLCV